MQYLGEIAAHEAKGIDNVRLFFSKSTKIPESITLMRLVRSLRPASKIIFVVHKMPTPNFEQLLREQGASLVIDNNQSVKEITTAVTELLKSTAAMGKSLVKNAEKVGKAASQLFAHATK